ncbi:5760_t:CDS:2 [Cetraspora pellucida]|uniref:5760_t:CDS:1 n=1 Tax=Cetraspora pellucida TaxID=1433469 RepID=A0ACA9P541_9GLOM|nr:5760_t:CDS:2 [Cetraspora pellucida]
MDMLDGYRRWTADMLNGFERWLCWMTMDGRYVGWFERWLCWMVVNDERWLCWVVVDNGCFEWLWTINDGVVIETMNMLDGCERWIC